MIFNRVQGRQAEAPLAEGLHPAQQRRPGPEHRQPGQQGQRDARGDRR